MCPLCGEENDTSLAVYTFYEGAVLLLGNKENSWSEWVSRV